MSIQPIPVPNMLLRVLALLAALALSFLAQPSIAQNAVDNGTFDTDLSSWDVSAISVWDSEDADGALNSGSLLHINDSDSEGNSIRYALRQCVEVLGSVDYDISFDGLVPAGQGIDGSAGIEIFWFESSSCSSGTHISGRTSRTESIGSWETRRMIVRSPAEARSVDVRLRNTKRLAGGVDHVVKFDNVSLSRATTSCVPDINTLCLSGGRFAVTADWRTQFGTAGRGETRELSGDTGTFSFFDVANTEIVVKVLNACSIGPTYYVFAGGLTNVEVTLTVTDTVTEQSESYINPLGELYLPVNDNVSFRCP